MNICIEISTIINDDDDYYNSFDVVCICVHLYFFSMV